MLKQDNTSVYVFDTSKANQTHFFNGSMNTLSLEFDPLVTGYAFFKWTATPGWVISAFPGFESITEKNFKEFSGINDIEMESNGMTNGFNANEYQVATGIKKGNTDFSIKHQEFTGSPIKNSYQYWVTGIRDPETGISTYPAIHGIDYCAKNHTGELIYIMTRPDANNVDRDNIEFACYYSAVMPTKIPLSHTNYSIGDHNLIEIDQQFKGNFHVSEKVDSFAKSVLRNKVYGFIELGEFDPLQPRREDVKDITNKYVDSKDVKTSDEYIVTRGNATDQ